MSLQAHDRHACGSASRTALSIVPRSVAGGSVVRSTMFIVPGAKLNGAGWLRGLIDEEVELRAGLLVDAALLHVLRDADDREPRRVRPADAGRSALADRVHGPSRTC